MDTSVVIVVFSGVIVEISVVVVESWIVVVMGTVVVSCNIFILCKIHRRVCGQKTVAGGHWNRNAFNVEELKRLVQRM